MWAQWDWGAGPVIAGRRTNLFCAWLAWSRFRVVIATWDRTLPTVIACVDRAMRAFGGAPTYWLTDNERTVTIDHVAGIAVRHPEIVAVGGHYGVTVATCVPADPESKGGSEATVRVAKADLVPTDANLRGDYAGWAELVEACEAFTAEVNARVHRVTRRPPVEMLTEERHRLHALPERPYTAALGETRKVSWSATVSFGAVTYSLPHTLADETVWVRVDGDQVVVTHCAPSGPIEVARHQRSTPGHPMIDDAHYPPRPAGPLARRPKPTSAAETEFLAIGNGARTWLVEAAAAGTSRVKVKMAQAVTLARLHGQIRVDCALGHAAMFGRFAHGELASILVAIPPGQRRRADDVHSLQPGTAAWGRPRRRPMNSAPMDEVVDLLRALRLGSHARRSTGPVGHRQVTTLGTGRSNARTAHRGARRPPSILNPGPAQSGRVPPPARPSTSGTEPSARSRRRPSGRCAPWNGSTATRTSSCADHQAHPRRTSLKRSAKPPSMRPQGVLVQSRAPRRARAPPQRRRHRRQGDPADHARRRHRDRRHRPDPGHHRDRRGALPGRRRRLREIPSPCRATFTPPGSTNSCPRPSPTPPSTGSSTTPTSS